MFVGFDAKTIDLEDYKVEVLQNTKLAVFLMATYGEGEPTDNATRFLQWLKNTDQQTPADFLKNTSFGVFGLGNKQYDHYNKMGIDVDKYLSSLGANRISELGLGDDNGTLEDDFEQWKQRFIATIMVKYHPNAESLGFTQEKLTALCGSSASSVETEVTIPAKIKSDFTIEFLSKSSSNKVTPNLNPKAMNTSTRHFFTAPSAPLLVNKELRKQNGKNNQDSGSTRHIELSLVGTGLDYTTADNLAILPENSVEQLAKVLHYDLDGVFTLTHADKDWKECFPTPCTVRDLLTKYLDIKVCIHIFI